MSLPCNPYPETCNLNYSEQNIRGLAINFLRQHYKLRPRSGTSGTRVVHRPHYYQGVTIDARLAYQQPNLEWFTATVEASSVDSAHEVLYRVNYFRIAAHALVITLAFFTAYLAITQVQGKSLWEQFGRPGVYLYLGNLFLVGWAVSGILLSRLKYYRYIYAIAQFIRFHANAQWVAYDHRIFDSIEASRGKRTRDRYYRELERQCLHFGFGLMEIRENNKVRWLIEPSHGDQFGGKRSRLPVWVAAAGKAPPLLKGLRGKLSGAKPSVAPASAPKTIPVPTDGLTDPLAVEAYLPMHVPKYVYAATVVPAKKGRKPWYKQPARLGKRLCWRVRNAIRSLYPKEIRRRPGYYELPWWVVLTGVSLLVAIATLGYLQAEWTPERRPGQVAAAPDLTPLEPARTPNESDARAEVLTGEYDHELTAREFDRQERELDLSPDPIIEAASPVANTLHWLSYDTSGVAEQSFGCGPFSRAEIASFLVSEGTYPTLDLATNRAAFINGRFKIPASVVLRDCLEEGLPGYLLYVGPIQAGGADANLMLRRYARRYGLELEVFVIE